MTTHLLAIQEDDWGSLRLITIDHDTGALNQVRAARYSNANYDNSRYLHRSANALCVMDSDGVLSFFNRDGEELFTSTAGAQSWGHDTPFRQSPTEEGSDEFTFYVTVGSGYVIPLNIVNRLVINPFLKTEVLTPLFDRLLVPQAVLNSGGCIFSTPGGQPVLGSTNSSSGVTKMWRMDTTDVWTEMFTSFSPSYNVFEEYCLVSSTTTTLELLIKKAVAGGLYKLVIDKATLGATPTLIVANAYSTVNPPIDGGSYYIFRDSGSAAASYGVSYPDSSPLVDYATGLGADMGTAGTGPTGGASAAVLLNGTTSIGVNMGLTSTNPGLDATVTLDVYFSDVTARATVLVGYGGQRSLEIKGGKLGIYSGDSDVPPIAESAVTLVVDTWYQISLGFKAGTTILRLAIDTAVEEFDIGGTVVLTHIGHRSEVSSVPGMTGRIAGFAQTGPMWAELVYLKPELNSTSAVTTTTNAPIAWAASNTRGRIRKNGPTIGDMDAVDAKLYNLSSGSFVDPTLYDLTYTNNPGSRSYSQPMPFNNYNRTAYVVGAFTVFVLHCAVKSFNTATHALVDEIVSVTSVDRELGYQGQNTIFMNVPTYTVTGTTTNEGAGNADGVKLRLMNNDSTQLLATTESVAGAFSFPCLTTTPKTVIGQHTNPTKPQMIRSGLIPS